MKQKNIVFLPKSIKIKNFKNIQQTKNLKSLNFKINLFYICEKIALSGEKKYTWNKIFDFKIQNFSFFWNFKNKN